MRTNSGLLILDDYEDTDLFIKGRKNKVWLKDPETEELYLFKSGGSNYEIFAEVLAGEVASNIGLEMASYDMATYNGEVGVVTKNFLEKGETIFSGDLILKSATELVIENNGYNPIYRKHSIDNIMMSISIMTHGQLTDKILEGLLKMWVFDGALMESDRNATNWSLIRDVTYNFRLSPIYDSSTIARLNNNVSDFTKNLYDEGLLYGLTKDIKQSLSLDNEDDDENFLKQFKRFCDTYPDYADLVIDLVKNIDIDKAINNIETRINSEKNVEFTFPYEISFWLRKSIGMRVSDMLYIYNLSKDKTSGIKNK